MNNLEVSTQKPVVSNEVEASNSPAAQVAQSIPMVFSDRFIAESCLDFLMIEMVNVISAGLSIDSDSDKDVAYYKLNNIGFRVGCGIAERLTQNRARFVDHFDIVKYICKEFWTAIFKKQIDNLKTNHRGVYVLRDSNFRWFWRLSSDRGAAETAVEGFLYPAFPCGFLRGTLANLGVSAMVAADITQLPQCTFQVKIQKQ